MEQVFNLITLIFTSLWGVAGLVAIGFGIYWIFNKQAKAKHIAILRQRLNELLPTDPEYNQVKQLLAAMTADTNMHNIFSYSEGGHAASHHHSGAHSGSDHSGSDYSGSDGGSDGGDGGGGSD